MRHRRALIALVRVLTIGCTWALLGIGASPQVAKAQVAKAPVANAQTANDSTPVRSTAWNVPSVDSLVRRAIARRGLQLADSSLLSYRANAHGFLAFLAQLGDGDLIPPRVIQSEELALSINWWQPGRSAQQLVGRRDTTLLPSQVAYYRDRYGVILDNLPDRIRLGDGFDVRDVPHPLAAGAAAQYEYAWGDTRAIRFTGRTIRVDEVRFRPRDPSKASAVGSVILDRETAAVVRLSMTFTRAAILDQRIERLVFTLENGLVETRYWLPRLQEVEVSRRSTWMDIPARGIVRGRWVVSGYEVNERVSDNVQRLPRWSSLPADSLRAFHFDGRVVDVLPPDIKVATDDDVAAARTMAESAVRAASLARASRVAASGRGISDLVRVTRTEGVSLGLGVSRRWGDGWQLATRGRYGFSDKQAKGRLSLAKLPALGGLPLVEAFAERDYRDLAPPERAGVTNSGAALLFGSDYTSQVDSRAAGVLLRRDPLSPWQLRVAYETEAPLTVRAKPLSGRYEAAFPAWRLRGARAELRGTGILAASSGIITGGNWSTTMSVGAYERRDNSQGVLLAGSPRVARATAGLSLEHTLSHDRALLMQTSVGVAGGRDLPPQWNALAGGPLSGAGYDWHAFAGRAILSERLELHQPVRAPAISLGKYGRAPAHVTLAPFVQVVALGGVDHSVSSAVNGAWPSAGMGMLFFFDLVRVDAARGLRDGRWRFALDIDRLFWGVL